MAAILSVSALFLGIALMMLGNGLLYVPVTEAKKPIDVLSMRDINLFLAPEEGAF